MISSRWVASCWPIRTCRARSPAMRRKACALRLLLHLRFDRLCPRTVALRGQPRDRLRVRALCVQRRRQALCRDRRRSGRDGGSPPAERGRQPRHPDRTGRAARRHFADCGAGLSRQRTPARLADPRDRTIPVEVRLETAATPDLLRQLAPDGVIVATGARRDMPDIAGSNLPQVFSGDDMRKLLLGEGSKR
jgi:hypothetical protein